MKRAMCHCFNKKPWLICHIYKPLRDMLDLSNMRKEGYCIINKKLRSPDLLFTKISYIKIVKRIYDGYIYFSRTFYRTT